MPPNVGEKGSSTPFIDVKNKALRVLCDLFNATWHHDSGCWGIRPAETLERMVEATKKTDWWSEVGPIRAIGEPKGVSVKTKV